MRNYPAIPLILALLSSCTRTGGDSGPATSDFTPPSNAGAFCNELTESDAEDAVGVSCVDNPSAGHACDDIAVLRVDKADVDALCASCDAAGTPCAHTPAVDCTTSDGDHLQVYSFHCE